MASRSRDLSGSGRLCLGTAQLGMEYGVANKTGRPSMEMANIMVGTAWAQGVRFFDTAQGYGESEQVLGDCLRHVPEPSEARVITKLEASRHFSNPSSVRESIVESLKRLQIPTLYGILIHNFSQMDDAVRATLNALRELQRDGLVLHLGASVYSAEEAQRALEVPEFDVLQAPYNLMNTHLVSQGVLARARALKKTIFCRSIYLQGLLAMPPDQVPESLCAARPWLEQASSCAARYGLSTKELAFAFVLATAPEAYIVFGADSAAQISENGQWAARSWPDIDWADVTARLSGVPEDIWNPAKWLKPQATKVS